MPESIVLLYNTNNKDIRNRKFVFVYGTNFIGSVKQVQCKNVLNIKTLQNKCGCTLFAQLGGRDTCALLRIFRLFWIPKKLIQPKNASQILLPLKITETKISNPKKSFDHLRHLKSGVPPSPSPRKMSKIVTQSVWIKWTVAIYIPYIVLKKVITLKSCLLVSFLNCCLIFTLLAVHLCNIYGDHETHTALCLKWVMIFLNFTSRCRFSQVKVTVCRRKKMTTALWTKQPFVWTINCSHFCAWLDI